MKQILVILPSRSGENSDRSVNVQRFYDNWKSNSEGLSDICIALDEDDQHRYPRIQDDSVFYEVNPRIRMIPTLNLIASKYADQYKYLAFFGDDHVILTNWESKFVSFFEENNNIGIAYGNDLLQGAKLPTAVCLTSTIVNKLGYMVPKVLVHMYADNFWIDLGRECGIIKYFEDVVFEHIHPDLGKADRDFQYVEAASVAPMDQTAYYQYVNSGGLLEDINKIKEIL